MSAYDDAVRRLQDAREKGDRQEIEVAFEQYRALLDEEIAAERNGRAERAAAPRANRTSDETSGKRSSEVKSGPAPSRAVTQLLSEVDPEPVNWLWEARIPLGKLTIQDGDPGLGKSVITIDIAARVSAGLAMPDGTASELGGPAGVVLVNAEDGLGDTIVPRLIAAGADRTRIIALTGVAERLKGVMASRPVMLTDLAEIEHAIAQVDARLLVVDPLMAYVPMAYDTSTDQHVRLLLSALKELAERTDCAVLLVRHMNKSPGGNPLYRGGGSIGIVGICRSAMACAPDPTDREGLRRVMAMTKCNLAAMPPSLAYYIEATAGEVAVVRWDGAVEMTARELLEPPKSASPERQELIDAVDEAEGPVDAPVLAKRLGWPEARVRYHLSAAAAARQIRRVATGMYAPLASRAPIGTRPDGDPSSHGSHPHNAHNAHSSPDGTAPSIQSTCEPCEGYEACEDPSDGALFPPGPNARRYAQERGA